MVFTRDDIINLSVRMGCNRDLMNKGMATTPHGDVFCIATLTGVYENGVYYAKGQKSPKEAFYCGVYSVRSFNRLSYNDYETRKNIAVTKTDGKSSFVYFFEKTEMYSKEYFFHGRYKYIGHDFIESNNPEHADKEILFHLLLVDRPNLK